MDMYQQILANTLARHSVKVTFENLKISNTNQVVELTCYDALRRIKTVLTNDTLDDSARVGRIIHLLENAGVDASLK